MGYSPSHHWLLLSHLKPRSYIPLFLKQKKKYVKKINKTYLGFERDRVTGIIDFFYLVTLKQENIHKKNN